MQRRRVESRWLSEVWEVAGVLAGVEESAAPRVLVEDAALTQWLHPGFELELRRDEAEGYYLNVGTDDPRVFVLWREQDGGAAPGFVTASYNEASRWMDGGAKVDSTAMPAELLPWVGDFVTRHYRPEPRKRIKPRSFMHPKDRARA